MFKKVLILSAAVGAGHLRAAEALEKQFKQTNAAEEVKNIDVLDYTNPLFPTALRQGVYRDGQHDARSSRLDV